MQDPSSRLAKHYKPMIDRFRTSGQRSMPRQPPGSNLLSIVCTKHGEQDLKNRMLQASASLLATSYDVLGVLGVQLAAQQRTLPCLADQHAPSHGFLLACMGAIRHFSQDPCITACENGPAQLLTTRLLVPLTRLLVGCAPVEIGSHIGDAYAVGQVIQRVLETAD